MWKLFRFLLDMDARLSSYEFAIFGPVLCAVGLRSTVSALGWYGLRRVRVELTNSGRNGGQEATYPDQGDHALHVVGEDMEGHFSADVDQPPHPEVRDAHPCLDRAERVLDR